MNIKNLLVIVATLSFTACATQGQALQPVTEADVSDPDAKPAPVTNNIVLPKRLKCVGEDVLKTGEDRPRHYSRAKADKVWHLWLILRCQDGRVYLGDPSREPEDGIWEEDAMITMVDFTRAIKRSTTEAEVLRQGPTTAVPQGFAPAMARRPVHPLAPGAPVAGYRTGRALMKGVATNCEPVSFEGLRMPQLAYTARYMSATHVALYSEEVGMYLPVRSCATQAPLATGHLDDDGDGTYEVPFEIAPVNQTIFVPSRSGSAVRMLWLRCDENGECQVLRRDRCERNGQRSQDVGQWACPV